MWYIFFCLLPCVTCLNFNCSIPPSLPKDQRESPYTWTLVQYNVEWLFSEPCSSCPGICTWNNSIDQYTHIETIQNILSSLHADTVHMCEVQSCTQLDQVKPSNDYSSYMIQGNDTSTGQNVGLITKIDPIQPLTRTETRVSYPIPNSQCGYTGNPGTEGVSKHLITQFMIQNVSIYLIGAHLLSNPNDPTSCAKREAQAQVLQQQIQSFMQLGHEVVMIGDLNDFDGVYQDINHHEPNSRVLDMLKGNSGNASNYTLYTLSGKMNQDARYTEWYDENVDCNVNIEEFSMLDHILVSQGLYSRIQYIDFYHMYREGCDTYQSDHYPILVRFGF